MTEFKYDPDYPNFLSYKQEVGGLYDEIGKLQFDYLFENGLKPDDTLVDIACGSLRGGRFFINYLNSGNYLGIEMQERLIQMAVKHELRNTYHKKCPEFIISSDFEFDKFTKKANVGIAQSIFTHLTLSDIEKCLKKLHSQTTDDFKLYATFHSENGEDFIPFERKNPPKSGAHPNFYYTKEQIQTVSSSAGFIMSKYCSWNHPRKQLMVEFVKTLKDS